MRISFNSILCLIGVLLEFCLSQVEGESIVLLKTGQLFTKNVQNPTNAAYLMIGGWFRWSPFTGSYQHFESGDQELDIGPSYTGNNNDIFDILITEGSPSITRALERGKWLAYAEFYRPNGTFLGHLMHPILPELVDPLIPSDKPINFTSVNSTHGYFKYLNNLNQHNLFYYIDYTGSITGTNGLAHAFSEIISLPTNSFPLVQNLFYKIWNPGFRLWVDGWKWREETFPIVTKHGYELKDYKWETIQFDMKWPHFKSEDIPDRCFTSAYTIRRHYINPECNVDISMTYQSYISGSNRNYGGLEYSYDVTTSTSTLKLMNIAGTVSSSAVEVPGIVPERIDLIFKMCLFDEPNMKVVTKGKMFINGGNYVQTPSIQYSSMHGLTQNVEVKVLFKKVPAASNKSTYYLWSLKILFGGPDYFLLTNISGGKSYSCMMRMVGADSRKAGGITKRCFMCHDGAFLNSNFNCDPESTNTTCTLSYNETHCSACNPTHYFYNKISHICYPRSANCSSPLVTNGTDYCYEPPTNSCNEFQNNQTGTCKCNIEHCSNCNTTVCTKCETGYYLAIQGALYFCTSTIPAGYGKDKTNNNNIVRPCMIVGCSDCSLDYNQCQNCTEASSNEMCETRCASECLTCSTSETYCSSCRSGMLVHTGGTCNVCDITNGYFTPDNLTCVACHTSCKTCNGGTANDCLTCSSTGNRLHSDGRCAVCDTSSSFYDNSTHCLSCNPACYSCFGGLDTSCLICASSGMKVLPNSTCGDCSTGPLYPLNTTHCSTCDPKCKTCTAGTSTDCTSCYPGERLFDNNTCGVCAGSFFNSSNGSIQVCKPCHSSCDLCSGPLETDCLTCRSGDALYPNNTCSICDVGGGFMLGNQMLPYATATCSFCHTSCLTCNGPLSTNCLTCDTDGYFYQNSCLSSCPSSTFQSSNTCLDCSTNCLTCSAMSTCLTCPPGKYLNETSATCVDCNAPYQAVQGDVCVLCYSKCATCRGAGDDNCTSCVGNTPYLSVLNSGPPAYGSCSSCNFPGKYQDLSTMQCKTCSPICKTCEGNSTNCTSCNTSKYLMAGGNTCLDCTDPGQTNNGTHCMNCEPQCSSCTTPSFCTQCSNTSKYLLESLGTCVDCNNVEGSFKTIVLKAPGPTKVCEKCDSSCKTCESTQYTCTSCNTDAGLYLRPDNTCGSCNLNNGEYIDGGLCLPCKSYCHTCEGNSSNCTSCHQGDSLFPEEGNKCAFCDPIGYYLEMNRSQISKCFKCNQTCLTCTNSSSCISCQSGLALYTNGKCGKCSEDGVTRIGDNCLPCFESCATCNGVGESDCLTCKLNYIMRPDHKCALKKSFKVVKTWFIDEKQEAWIVFDAKIESMVGELLKTTDVIVLQADVSKVKDTLAKVEPPSQQLSTLEEYQKIESIEVKDIEIVKDTLIVRMSFSETVSAGTLVLMFKSLPSLMAENEPNIVSQNKSFVVAPIEIVATGFDQAISAVAGPAAATLSTATTLLLLISLPQAFILMKVFQTVDYYIFIDGIYPINYSGFLQMMSNNIMDYVPNLFEGMADTEGSPLPERLEQFGVEVHILDNLGQYFTLVSGLATAKLVCKLVQLALNKIWKKGANKMGSRLIITRIVQFHRSRVLLWNTRGFSLRYSVGNHHPCCIS